MGETKTTTYVYADSDGGYFDGQTISVTADDHTTTYTFNDFSQRFAPWDLVADIDSETIDIGYDPMSRLSQEKLTDGGGAHWDMDYEYDDIGNRTRRNDNTGAPGDISFTYETGNREDTVTDSIDPLEYDFKGNVKGRMTLDGNRVYHYAWNAWDRLTSATLVTGGDHTVNYTYDAQGRMLGRLKSGDSYATVNYWLGLNKIAEEIATDLSVVVRPDDEATTNPQDAGWMNYGEELSDAGDENSYETDPVRGKYFHAQGDGLFGSGVAFIGDSFGSDVNPYDSEFDTEHHVVGLWFRNNNTGDPITIQIGARNAGDDPYSFDLITDDGSDGGGQYYLGAALNDGEWHYVELDLAEAWVDASYGGVFGHIDSLALIGADLDADLDDIILSGGKLGKSYQLIKDAQIGAYMGVQSGSDGGESQAAWSKWYHHYNDLGTVQATSNYSGTLIAASEPDFYGNYQHVYGTRPDSMGITSKFYDSDVELYYFNERWYDSERGRWMSKDPIGYQDDLSLYGFVKSEPYSLSDPTGENSIVIAWCVKWSSAADLLRWVVKTDGMPVKNGDSCLCPFVGTPEFDMYDYRWCIGVGNKKRFVFFEDERNHRTREGDKAYWSEWVSRAGLAGGCREACNKRARKLTADSEKK